MAASGGKKSDDVLIYSFSTLSILQLIKDAQQQHGLRHSDYLRYRAYCSRKIRRVRRSLHFTNIHKYKGPFQPRTLTPELVADTRYLAIPLFNAERCWAHAMQLKQESNTEPRKRFHLHSRLRKAVKFSGELENLCKVLDQVDARTKLEAQAYNQWLHGCLHYEVQEWQSALECFGSSKHIYEKLCSAFSSNATTTNLYKQRCAEMDPHIRFCRYNSGDKSEIADIVKMRLTLGGQDSEDLDNLIAQAMALQSQEVKPEVKWCSHTINLEHPAKVRTFFSTLKGFDDQIQKIDDMDAKFSLYERLLIDCRDAIQATRDEAKGEHLKTELTKGDEEALLTPAQLLHSFLCYVRLSKTVDRYLLMIENTLSEKDATANPEAMDVDSTQATAPALASSTKQPKKKKPKTAADQSKATLDGKKQSKPQDLVRLYDTVLQNLAEIEGLPGADTDKKFLEELRFQNDYFKAFRCFYMAEAFGDLKKWREAIALFDRAAHYVSCATKGLQKASSLNSKHVSLQFLQELSAKINVGKYTAYANSISGAEESGPLSTVFFSKPLMDEPNKYYQLDTASLSAGKCPPLVRFPPDFQPIACKPLFFDLALNHVQFPSLDHRIEPEKNPADKEGAAGGGISGLVKGWFWGGKK